MFKKPILISLSVVLAAVVLFLVFPSSNGQAGVNFKKALAERMWAKSGHGDKKAEAFNDWNDAGTIPVGCAKCHSSLGFRDFLGADGTAGGVVDKAPAVGTTVDCLVCHTDNEKGILRQNASVQFPSGVVVDNLGPEGLCIECHQGRQSKSLVDAKIAGAGVANDDTSSTKLSFSNIHYFAAAAVQFGTAVKSGYEYTGKEYDYRFSHITGYNSCTTCHNPHSLEVNLKACNTCHIGVKDPKDIRYIGSQVDYDGDGDITEGMYYEIRDIMDKAYAAIQNYARTVLRRPIVYNGGANPYWFFDNNGNGVADADDTTTYNAFSARLLKAAYNYQIAMKEPNNYAHGGKYIIQLLYDGIEDLNTKLAVPTDLSAMSREDEGHFNGGSMPWRDWDDSATKEVQAACAKCHSATGLEKYLALGQPSTGLTAGEPISNGMLCTTCHTSPPALRSAPSVIFPSGMIATLGDASNLCMVCHQGRESMVSLNTKINASPTSKNLTFTNVHYFPAAAIFFGTEVKGAYEFSGKAYSVRQPYPNHGGRFSTCVQCHMGSAKVKEEHNWTMRNHNVAEPMKEYCVGCHGQDISQTFKGYDAEKFDFEQIRPGNIPDYDGDGNTRESLKDEILGLESALYAQILVYTKSINQPVIYSGDAYPYWYKDLNGNGLLDPNEATSANSARFDAKGLRAAYNLQVSSKEPHGFIHNARYIAEILSDSIQHLGGDVSRHTWR